MSAAPEARGRELRIGDVARLAGTTPRTIRYYEEIGLLPAASGRVPGAHRTYAEADVERLADLLRLKDLLGVSLEELKELIEAEDARATLRREWRSGVDDPIRRRQILDESLGHISRQLELVRRRRDEIAKLEAVLVAKRKRIRGRLRELGVTGATADEAAR
ncbi:MAG: MerR family transcriptional regulator [Solirubrobacterales bacterium]